MSTGPKYPGQQLDAVGLEVYFPGSFRLHATLPDIQREFGARLPQLLVPNAQPGIAMDLQPALLRSTDGREGLAVALNQVSYLSFDYPGHKEFLGQALPILLRVLELADIPVLNRVAYRYDNGIGVARDLAGHLPLARILNLALPDGGEADLLRDIGLTWTRSSGRGHVLGRLGIESRNGSEVLKINIAAVVEPAGSVDTLEEIAGEAHATARAAFETMITDSYRDAISRPAQDDDPESP